MNSSPTDRVLRADLRPMDPVSYIRATSLRPEDSYGSMPVEHDDGSALVYIPEYSLGLCPDFDNRKIYIAGTRGEA